MKTIEEIYDEMKEGCESRMGLALSDTGDLAIRLWAFAAQVYSLCVQQDFVKRQMFPQTAEGEYLDYHAEVRGISRLAAQKATGVIEIYIDEPSSADISVASGLSCTTETGMEFVTTQSGVIAAGETYCKVTAEAKIAGADGNVPAGSVCYLMLAPNGISGCGNATAFSGGTDEESDGDLRERVIASYRTLPNGTNKAYYESTVLSCGGVAAATVLPKNRGLGTVDIIVASEAGEPTDELLETVKETLDRDREICVDIQVLAPEKVEVPVAAAIMPEDGYSMEELLPRVSDAVEKFFCGERLGQDVLLAQLGNLIYSVDGVANYAFTSPTADIPVGSAELPVLSEFIITEMGGA
jgi:uncharacterized phage protein gp47/JayE